MNFIAHADVARRHRADPRFVLGAVLPDLVPMLGLTITRDDVEPVVAEGWRFHHVVDEAFHADPYFLAGVRALRDDLRSTPLHTGARRAVAHVGWELLLDDVVPPDAFYEAVALLDLDPPRAPSLSTAERVHRAVSRRPRLAYDASLTPTVAAVLEQHRNAVADAAPHVLSGSFELSP